MQKMCVCPSPCCCCLFMCGLCHIRTSFWFPFIACAVQKHAFDIYGHEKLALDRCGHTINQRVTVVQSRRRNLLCDFLFLSCRRRSDCVTVNCCFGRWCRPIRQLEGSLRVLTLAKFKSKMNSDHSSLHDHCENMFANYVNSKCITIAVVEVTITAYNMPDKCDKRLKRFYLLIVGQVSPISISISLFVLLLLRRSIVTIHRNSN